MNKNIYQNWELGERNPTSFSDIKKVAEVLGISVGEICSVANEMKTDIEQVEEIHKILMRLKQCLQRSGIIIKNLRKHVLK